MGLAAISPPAEVAPRTSAQNRRMLILISLSLLVSTVPEALNLPLKYLLKDHLHLKPDAVANFFALQGFAWYFKPLAGFFSDRVTLFGTRRRGYLLLSSIVAVVFWGLLDLMPKHIGPLLWASAAICVAAVLMSSVAGGLIVEMGQSSGMTGRLSSLRQTLLTGAGLLSGPIGGFLAARAFGWTCLTGGLAFFLMIPVVLIGMPEKRQVRGASTFTADLRDQLRAMGRSRPLWIATAFIFLDQVSPGFGTPLFYYQTDTLKFSSQFIGNLGLVSGVAGLLGTVLYGVLCAHVPLRRMLVAGIILSSLGSLLYLGYHSHGSAIVIEALNALMSVAVQIALMDLAARATPRGSEALGYSLLMSAFNLGTAVSDVIGSHLYVKLHLPLSNLIWINVLTSALPLLALSLIPRALTASPDGIAPETA